MLFCKEAAAKSTLSTVMSLSKGISIFCRADMAAEQGLAASPTYMERHGTKELSQQFLEPSMRTVTVSWLVEVRFQLLKPFPRHN